MQYVYEDTTDQDMFWKEGIMHNLRNKLLFVFRVLILTMAASASVRI